MDIKGEKEKVEGRKGGWGERKETYRRKTFLFTKTKLIANAKVIT